MHAGSVSEVTNVGLTRDSILCKSDKNATDGDVYISFNSEAGAHRSYRTLEASMKSKMIFQLQLEDQ